MEVHEMIDLSKERVISLTEAARELPRRRKGVKPHVATLYRWASRGLRNIRLETIQVGGTLCTSVEALQRFCAQLSSHNSPQITPLHSRSKALQRASSRLQALGLT